MAGKRTSSSRVFSIVNHDALPTCTARLASSCECSYMYIYILTCIPEVLQAFCSQVKRPVESPRRIVETGAMIKLLNVLWLSGGIQLQFDGAFSKAPLNPFVDLLSTLAA